MARFISALSLATVLTVAPGALGMAGASAAPGASTNGSCSNCW